MQLTPERFKPQASGVDLDAVSNLPSLIEAALQQRGQFLARLTEQGTDCYRLFHGSQEGWPGLTLDIYGDLALIQSFHETLEESDLDALGDFLLNHPQFENHDIVYNDRSAAGSRVRQTPLDASEAATADRVRLVHERGLVFEVRARHRGQDPWLFLDQRATRAAVAAEANGKTVLNLFAYTCSVGVAAAAAGASTVVNVDFAESALRVGSNNARHNEVESCCNQLASDVFPVLRQLAGLGQPRVVRGRRLPPFPSLEPQQFDLVFLDPPRHAKSAFGVVDLVRDYQALFKPALLATATGGALYCSNNVAAVDEAEWHEALQRCATKNGRALQGLEIIRPDEDFPSRDGKPPLKVARLQL